MRLKFLCPLILLVLAANSLSAQVRIKDVVTVENAQHKALVGYGLVVGLNGTGDRPTSSRGAVFTVQSISNMLERFGCYGYVQYSAF